MTPLKRDRRVRLRDSCGLYNTPDGYAKEMTAPYRDFWLGMSSTGEARFQARDAWEGPFIDFSDQAAANMIDGKRLVEFKIPWEDFTYTPNDIEAGYVFQCDPLMVDGVDGSYVGQSFIGGSLYPGSVDPDDQSYVRLTQLAGPGDPGDADIDGDVDDDDLSLLLASWGLDTDWGNGEFSGTPPVDDDDLSLLLANWTGATTAAVPEPALLSLLAVGGLMLFRRMGRRK